MIRARSLSVGGFVVAAVALAAGALVRSGITEISSVRVVGARSSDPVTIRAASGLRPGMNALTVDLGEATERVERVPGIERAVVERDGTLDIVIRIQEEAARLVVVTPEERFSIDADARRVAMPAFLQAVPRLRLETSETLTPTLARDALTVWAAMGPRERRAGVSWGMQHGFSIESEGSRILLGDVRRIEAKLAAARAIRPLIPGGVQRIDVRGLPQIAVS